MAHQLIEVLPPPFPEPETARFYETGSVAQDSNSTAGPRAYNPYSQDFPQDNRANWKRWMRRLIPRPPIAILVLLVIVTGIAFCPALLSNSKPFDFIVLDGVSPETDGVQILGNIFHFDWLDPSKVSVTWSVIGYGNYSLQTAIGFPNDTFPPAIALDVYLDDPTKPALSYDPTLLPVQWNGERLPVRSLFSFNAQHKIDRGIQYFAPDDSYSFSASVFAIDRATNASIPIISFELTSSGPGDFGTTSEVVPSTSRFTYNPGSGPTTARVKSHTIFGTIARSVPARALTYSMFAINWVLALCSIITTSVAFNRGSRHGDVGMTLLPVTVILTIPAVRNLYVGSPPFGIFLDVVGFFPQMLIVASCTVIVLSGYAVRSMRMKGVKNGEKEKGGVLEDTQQLRFLS